MEGKSPFNNRKEQQRFREMLTADHNIALTRNSRKTEENVSELINILLENNDTSEKKQEPGRSQKLQEKSKTEHIQIPCITQISDEVSNEFSKAVQCSSSYSSEESLLESYSSLKKIPDVLKHHAWLNFNESDRELSFSMMNLDKHDLHPELVGFMKPIISQTPNAAIEVHKGITSTMFFSLNIPHVFEAIFEALVQADDLQGLFNWYDAFAPCEFHFFNFYLYQFLQRLQPPTWKIMSQELTFSRTILEDFHEKIFWALLIGRQKIEEDILQKCTKVYEWHLIWQRLKVSEAFIQRNIRWVDWTFVCRYQRLSEDFIRKFKTQVIWHRICRYQILSEEFMDEHADLIDWKTAVQYQTVSEDFLARNVSRLNWFTVCKYKLLSENFIRNHLQYIHWFNICRYQILSEDFVEEHQEKMYWNILHRYQRFSEKFMLKFVDKIRWNDLLCSRKKNVSEPLLIRLHEEGIRLEKNTWKHITSEYSLSVKFMESFIVYIHWNVASYTQRIPEILIKAVHDLVDWSDISVHQSLSQQFVVTFCYKVDWKCILAHQYLPLGFLRHCKKVLQPLYWHHACRYYNTVRRIMSIHKTISSKHFKIKPQTMLGHRALPRLNNQMRALMRHGERLLLFKGAVNVYNFEATQTLQQKYDRTELAQEALCKITAMRIRLLAHQMLISHPNVFKADAVFKGRS